MLQRDSWSVLVLGLTVASGVLEMDIPEGANNCTIEIVYAVQRDKPEVRSRERIVTLGVREDRVKHGERGDNLHQNPGRFSCARSCE